MREDMPKVIIDLPREGSFLRNRKSGLRLRGEKLRRVLDTLDEYDSGPSTFPMCMRNRYTGWFGTKRQTDRLNPLERFLKKQVGRNWNAIHSEISRRLDNRTVVNGRHFWTHVEQYVELHCYIADDGFAYVREYSGYKVSGLYVHPTTNILCFQKVSSSVRNPKKGKFFQSLEKYGVGKHNPEDFRVISKGIILERRSGVWFINTYVPYLPDDVVGFKYAVDKVTGKPKSIPIYFKELKYHPAFRLVSTRQMGKKELKRYKTEISGNPF